MDFSDQQGRMTCFVPVGVQVTGIPIGMINTLALGKGSDVAIKTLSLTVPLPRPQRAN